MKIKENIFVEEDLNSRDKKIIVISDVHLGYLENRTTPIFDQTGFEKFLSQIEDHTLPCSRLIICGDFFDIWRRDFAGVFIENHNIITMLENIDNDDTIRLHFIVGNHDFYLRHLRNHLYPFPFFQALKLNGNNCDYRFLHGYQFDPIQIEAFFDLLCLADDNLGEDLSGFWKKIQIGVRAFKGNPIKIITNWGKLQSLLLPPNERIRRGFEIRRHPAIEYAVNTNSILVFGHTHEPFVESIGGLIVANAGSWVSPGPSTYIEINIPQQKVILNSFQNGSPNLEAEEDINC